MPCSMAFRLPEVFSRKLGMKINNSTLSCMKMTYEQERAKNVKGARKACMFLHCQKKRPAYAVRREVG